VSYQLVEQLQKKAVSVTQACRVLQVSQSGYYAARMHRRRAPVACAASVQLKAAFAASGRAHGSRRLCAALKKQGVTMGRHRARTLMRAHGLRPVWKRKFMHTTDSRHGLAVSPSVLARQFDQPLPNRAGVCDITYIRTRTRSGWLYLAAGWPLAFTQDRWLGHGARDACSAGVRGLANGHHAAQPLCGSCRAFRPGHTIRKWRASSVTDKPWPGGQHEPQRQLLR
jgi:hypothetical protein